MFFKLRLGVVICFHFSIFVPLETTQAKLEKAANML